MPTTPNDPITSCAADSDAVEIIADGAVVSDSNPLPVVLESGDIEIGAVEIKDESTDVRANVLASGSSVAATDNSLIVAVSAVLGGTVANGAADTGAPIKVGGVFNTVFPVLDSGDRGDVQLDASGRQIVTLGTLIAGEDLADNVLGVGNKPTASASYSGTAFTNFGAATAISVKASAGNLLWITCTNENAAVRFLQLHNKASTPSAGEVPVVSFPIPGGTAAQPAVIMLGTGLWSPGGQFFGTGVAVGISTTEGTYTAATASEHTTNGGFV